MVGAGFGDGVSGQARLLRSEQALWLDIDSPEMWANERRVIRQ